MMVIDYVLNQASLMLLIAADRKKGEELNS